MEELSESSDGLTPHLSEKIGKTARSFVYAYRLPQYQRPTVLGLIYIAGDGLGYRLSDSKPNGYIALYRNVRIAQTRIPTPYFSIGQEPKSISISESVSGNVNEPLNVDVNFSINVTCERTSMLYSFRPDSLNLYPFL